MPFIPRVFLSLATISIRITFRPPFVVFLPNFDAVFNELNSFVKEVITDCVGVYFVFNFSFSLDFYDIKNSIIKPL